MNSSPKVDLAIFTGRTNKQAGPLYYITVEITSATGIVPELFVMTQDDEAKNTYSYSRVASILDIQVYGTSSVTTSNGYRTNQFTVETNSLSYLKDLREGVQLVLQSLLDEVSNSHELMDLDSGQATTVTIVGGVQNG